MPTEAIDRYRYPPFGIAHLSKEGQLLGEDEEEFIDCTYSIAWDMEHVCFQNGWTDFTNAANIGNEALLLMKVEPMQEFIGLNFVEIIN